MYVYYPSAFFCMKIQPHCYILVSSTVEAFTPVFPKSILNQSLSSSSLSDWSEWRLFLVRSITFSRRMELLPEKVPTLFPSYTPYLVFSRCVPGLCLFSSLPTGWCTPHCISFCESHSLFLCRSFYQYVKKRKTDQFEERVRQSLEMSNSLHLHVPELITIGESILSINIHPVFCWVLYFLINNWTRNHWSWRNEWVCIIKSERSVNYTKKPRWWVVRLLRSHEMGAKYETVCRIEVEKRRRAGEVTYIVWSCCLFIAWITCTLLSLFILTHLILYTIPFNLTGQPLISWTIDTFIVLQEKHPSIMMLLVFIRSL